MMPCWLMLFWPYTVKSRLSSWFSFFNGWSQIVWQELQPFWKTHHQFIFNIPQPHQFLRSLKCRTRPPPVRPWSWTARLRSSLTSQRSSTFFICSTRSCSWMSFNEPELLHSSVFSSSWPGKHSQLRLECVYDVKQRPASLYDFCAGRAKPKGLINSTDKILK